MEELLWYLGMLSMSAGRVEPASSPMCSGSFSNNTLATAVCIGVTVSKVRARLTPARASELLLAFAIGINTLHNTGTSIQLEVLKRNEDHALHVNISAETK
jgi:hypothetical protein